MTSNRKNKQLYFIIVAEFLICADSELYDDVIRFMLVFNALISMYLGFSNHTTPYFSDLSYISRASQILGYMSFQIIWSKNNNRSYFDIQPTLPVILQLPVDAKYFQTH